MDEVPFLGCYGILVPWVKQEVESAGDQSIVCRKN